MADPFAKYNNFNQSPYHHHGQHQSPSRAQAEPLKHFYTQSNADANRESIAQLKSNIELLFKGATLFTQFGLYPLKVVRWQSQIHSESYRYHLTPFTIFPIFYNLRYQGYSSLWKGTFSMGAFSAISSTLENVLAEVTPFEKALHTGSKSSKLYGQVIIKFISCAITTPIYAAVVYESVQSGVSSDSIGILELAKETWNRITGYRYNYRTRLIPLWSLILPTSFYFISVDLLSSLFEKFFMRLIKSISDAFDDKKSNQVIDEIEQEVVEMPYIHAAASLAANITALIALYPIETTINRLIVQGTRTIIDNTDNGSGVVPINTRYEGFFDCMRTIEHTEGMLGLYKGVGVAVLETTISFALLKLAKFIGYKIYDAVWISRNDKSNLEFLTQQSVYRPTE